MISFVIIGRNEGWKLTKCLQSVIDFVNINELSDYEVIYVDSDSSDDSIDRAGKYENVKIFRITGVCNAAIGRNIGAKESAGDIIWFMDGDMEIVPEFYDVAFEKNGNLKYDFVSGAFENHYYDYDWNFLYKKDGLNKFETERYVYFTGGIFIIKKELWLKAGGMKTKYKRNQDLDFGLRMARLGIPIIRKREMIAVHHTIPYSDMKRTWKLLFSGAEMYPMVLFRDHLLIPAVWKLFLFQNYTMLFLILNVILNIVFSVPYTFLFYLFLVIFKSWNLDKKSLRNILSQIPKIIIRDVLNFYALLAFYPKTQSIDYQRIK